MAAKVPRDRIIESAAALLAEGGRDAVSTRAVCAAAGVQTPTIYRLFGDMRGLLDAVASHGFTAYLAQKSAIQDSDDPVADLRAGWDLHVGFGLAQPSLYTLIFGDARPGQEPAAALKAAELLAYRVKRIAQAGRLRVSEERAAQFVHATGKGVTLTLIATPPEQRDLGLSSMARESVLAAVTSESPPDAAGGLTNAAVSLRASLDDAAALSLAERNLLDEWLLRISKQ
ncbi:TetR family transcriptional regulator [Micromonospora qiuiae]|uniref:TetR family transcriptional regulator n=1 Tax=Micromonospora qiuiae TaxID=502268 RepID=A0ABQ4J6N9_9ACTN|nr:TetR/AcrR family transcriptional regulator [Micromonospora qiuiae]GIJ25844.1 TetR family transcriptional regulator [Micromonospora qiuiae]